MLLAQLQKIHMIKLHPDQSILLDKKLLEILEYRNWAEITAPN